MSKFVFKKTYYTQPTYEFNLPAGHTCPYAKECKVCVDRDTGKFHDMHGEFRCYAANAERFPPAREHRWKNYEDAKEGKLPDVTPKVGFVRIHASGDFFSQEYFDQWLEVCHENPGTVFWAFTKSIPFWVRRIDDIPDNLTLNASYGGHRDDLIEQHNLKSARVYKNKELVPEGMLIDYDDSLAMYPGPSFALLDNFK